MNSIDKYISEHLVQQISSVYRYHELIMDDASDFVTIVAISDYYISEINWFEHLAVEENSELAGGGPLDKQNGGTYYAESYLYKKFTKEDSAEDILSYIKNIGDKYLPHKLCPAFCLTVRDKSKASYELRKPDKSYDQVFGFSDGIAQVRSDKKWGYIEASGKELIPPSYAYAGRFSEGLAPVRINVGSKMGYIDYRGKMVLPEIYSYACEFSEGLAAVITPEFNWHYISKSGEIKIRLDCFKMRCIHAGAFINGFAIVVFAGDDGSPLYALINRKGEPVLPAVYHSLRHFKNGVYAARMSCDDEEFYIDAAGNKVNYFCSCKHDICYKGEYIAVYEGKLGDAGEAEAERNAIMKKIGQMLPECREKELSGKCKRVGGKPCSGNVCEFEELNLKGSRLSRQVWDIRYADFKCGFADNDGNVIIEPQYEYVGMNRYRFSDGVAAVKKNGRFGYITPENKIAVPFEYEDAVDFRDGCAAVKKEGEWYILREII